MVANDYAMFYTPRAVSLSSFVSDTRFFDMIVPLVSRTSEIFSILDVADGTQI